MADFIYSHYELGPDKKVTIGDLHAKYKEWCFANGYKAMGKINFGRAITERDGIAQAPGADNVQYYTGIGLK